MDRVAEIRRRLERELAPSRLEIEDESRFHVDHAAGGMGHFSVLIVSDRFAGRSTLERHRMVYGALGDLMQTEIHALSMKTLTPDEAR
jgi:BolA protein